ncbi:MAG: hypothetical protein JNM09_22170 [Blastocatellia bacterium]|nr:hypothetical protein [Blastocatellia bacterium]
MSLKFQTRKWDIEINWEQLTITPLGTTLGGHNAMIEDVADQSQSGTASYFLFDLIGQLFGSTQKQEQLSK